MIKYVSDTHGNVCPCMTGVLTASMGLSAVYQIYTQTDLQGRLPDSGHSLALNMYWIHVHTYTPA